MLNIIKIANIVEDKREANRINPIQLKNEIKEISAENSIELDNFFNVDSVILYQFINCFLSAINKEKFNLQYNNVEINIDFYFNKKDFRISRSNIIYIKDIFNIKAEGIEKVFIYDDYLCIIYKNKTKLIIE